MGDEGNEILTSSMNKSLVVVEPAPREDGLPFLPPVSLVLSYFVILNLCNLILFGNVLRVNSM